jgi:hypothetical protein
MKDDNMAKKASQGKNIKSKASRPSSLTVKDILDEQIAYKLA